MKSLLVWSTVLFASVATACSASPPGPSPGTGGDIEIGRGAAVPFSDPGDGMAKALAQTEAIPLAEARRRLVVQHEGSILADKLRGIYGEKFAGAMFERTPPGTCSVLLHRHRSCRGAQGAANAWRLSPASFPRAA